MNALPLSRRQFIGRSAAAAAGALVFPRRILAQSPARKLNIAVIGAGGMGASNMQNLVSQNIVAICDVDSKRVEQAFYRNDGQPRAERAELKAAYERAKQYKDFRRMLERQKDIEAVVIATPDHTHAVAAAMAMKLGKHVYVQKPLTYSVEEARVLKRLARETGVVTQMGNQGHSRDEGRRLVEVVRAGVLGRVGEVHIWTNRPIWPQGMPRPAQPEPVPAHLDWDLFLGPAPEVPYHSSYLPFNWRGWTDWGTGALGDMGAHLIDHAYWALELEYPTWVEASGSPYGDKEKASYPVATLAHYGFERPGREPMRMTWYDGGLLPARPELVPAEVEVNRGGGAMLIGDKGVAVYDTYGANLRLFPQALEEQAAAVPTLLDRIGESHEMNWVHACQGDAQASCPFDYAAPLTETMLLGMVALRTGYGRRIYWDGQKGEITNAPEANQFLHRPYRQGWTL